MAKNLNELRLHSAVLWKIKLVNDEIGYLTEAISKQSVEGIYSLAFPDCL